MRHQDELMRQLLGRSISHLDVVAQFCLPNKSVCYLASRVLVTECLWNTKYQESWRQQQPIPRRCCGLLHGAMTWAGCVSVFSLGQTMNGQKDKCEDIVSWPLPQT